MAASMWRMNGLCRSMAGLLLCTLLFSSEVMSDDDAAVPDVPTSNPTGPDVSVASNSSEAGPSQAPAASGESVAPSAAAGDLVIDVFTNVDVRTQENVAPETAAAPAASDVNDLVPVVPAVTCIKTENITEQPHIKAVLDNTDDCDKTKAILEQNPAKWCSSQNCSLNIFQKGNNVFVTSSDAEPVILAEALKSENLKEKLGVSKVETPSSSSSSSSSSSVFVGILVSGILAAIGITVGYFKCQQRPDTKTPKMAEEAYPVDQENQGNTLVSEAPLNPPPETQEKPSVNGESPEADKTQTPPPTNGHSTAKTADTEL